LTLFESVWPRRFGQFRDLAGHPHFFVPFADDTPVFRGLAQWESHGEVNSERAMLFVEFWRAWGLIKPNEYAPFAFRHSNHLLCFALRVSNTRLDQKVIGVTS
jgi:hypothetical protein